MAKKKGWVAKAIIEHELEHKPPTPEARKNFEEFWAPIVCDKTGRLVRDRVINELHDFHFLIQEVPKVYMEVTGGELSKLTYAAKTVIDVANDYQNKVWEETLQDEKETWEASGTLVGPADACYVNLRSGPPARRPVDVVTSDGSYRVYWDLEADRIVVDSDKPLPEEWLDTVLDAVKTLDKKES